MHDVLVPTSLNLTADSFEENIQRAQTAKMNRRRQKTRAMRCAEFFREENDEYDDTSIGSSRNSLSSCDSSSMCCDIAASRPFRYPPRRPPTFSPANVARKSTRGRSKIGFAMHDDMFAHPPKRAAFEHNPARFGNTSTKPLRARHHRPRIGDADISTSQSDAASFTSSVRRLRHEATRRRDSRANNKVIAYYGRTPRMMSTGLGGKRPVKQHEQACQTTGQAAPLPTTTTNNNSNRVEDDNSRRSTASFRTQSLDNHQQSARMLEGLEKIQQQMSLMLRCVSLNDPALHRSTLEPQRVSSAALTAAVSLMDLLTPPPYSASLTATPTNLSSYASTYSCSQGGKSEHHQAASSGVLRHSSSGGRPSGKGPQNTAANLGGNHAVRLTPSGKLKNGATTVLFNFSATPSPRGDDCAYGRSVGSTGNSHGSGGKKSCLGPADDLAKTGAVAAAQTDTESRGPFYRQNDASSVFNFCETFAVFDSSGEAPADQREKPATAGVKPKNQYTPKTHYGSIIPPHPCIRHDIHLHVNVPQTLACNAHRALPLNNITKSKDICRSTVDYLDDTPRCCKFRSEPCVHVTVSPKFIPLGEHTRSRRRIDSTRLSEMTSSLKTQNCSEITRYASTTPPNISDTLPEFPADPPRICCTTTWPSDSDCVRRLCRDKISKGLFRPQRPRKKSMDRFIRRMSSASPTRAVDAPLPSVD